MLELALLSVQFLLTAALPIDYEGAQWGITVPELQKLVTVKKASFGGSYNYSDHMEKNPDVYVRTTSDKQRIEYYFYNHKLYKIYVVYNRKYANKHYYKKLVATFIKRYGPPANNYQERVFGITIQHTLWENLETSIDIRSGAGFIYQVRADKQVSKQKAAASLKDKAI